MNRLYRLVCASVLALAVALLTPMTAHAIGYRAWGFFQLDDDGEWSLDTEDAHTVVPEDGGVDGYRFAVAADDDVRVPRDAPDFDDLCARTPAVDGMKRVGLVLDTGRDVDAPRGETAPEPSARCVVADEDATSLDILTQAVEDIRTDDDLICGIADFPQQGCGEEVREPTPEQLAADEPIEIPIVDGDATEEPSATQPSTEPTSETATDAPTEDEAEDEDESTSQETTEADASAEATATDTEPTPGEADTTADSDSDIPPWAWAVGVVVLLGILGWTAAAARNRRLDEAHDDYAEEFRGDPRDGYSDHPPEDFDRR